MRTLETIIEHISPSWALSRQRNRLTTATLRAYEAASPKDTWRPRRAGAGANADHLADAATMRGKARSLYQNVSFIKRGINGKVNYLIGTGITSYCTSPNGTDKKVDTVLSNWADECDADSQHNLFSLEYAAWRAVEIDGEVLIRLRPRRREDSLSIPLQIQLLEIDWLDTAKNGPNGNNVIISGIEYDPIGRIVAYWLFPAHPGELAITSRNAYAQSKPLPAQYIIHVYAPARPGAARGISSLHATINRTRDLATYEDSEAARKNLESRLGLAVSGAPNAALPNLDPYNQQPGQGGPAGLQNLGQIPGGGIVRLPDGMTISQIKPEAIPGTVEYAKHQLRMIAAGIETTYEIMTGDLSEVNFSSGRLGRIDFKRTCEVVQWLDIIPRLRQRILKAAAAAAYLDGTIPTPNPKWDHTTPKWDYVNPREDIAAEALEIATGLSTWSEKLRSRGIRPTLHWAELKNDVQTLRDNDLLDLLVMLQKSRTLSEADPTAQTAPQK